jgi:hypothetical protein
MAIAGMLAGCGGSSAPEIATARTAGPTATSSKAGPAPSAIGAKADIQKYLEAQRAWVDCLRKHGLNPPDPNQYGSVLWTDMPVKANSSFVKAMNACASLQMAPPASVIQAQRVPLTPEEIAIKRRYARCMQQNGAPDFPDPGPDGEFADKPWDQTSSGAAKATAKCAPIIGDPVSSGPGVG